MLSIFLIWLVWYSCNMLAWNKGRLLDGQYSLWQSLWVGHVQHGSYSAQSWFISTPVALIMSSGHIFLVKFPSINTCRQGIMQLRTFSCWKWKPVLIILECFSIYWMLYLQTIVEALISKVCPQIANYQLKERDRDIQCLGHGWTAD